MYIDTITELIYSKADIKNDEDVVLIFNHCRGAMTHKPLIWDTIKTLDKVRKEAILPLFCPNCGSLMKKRNDAKMYKIHKKCFDCVVEMEHKLRIEGKYKDYERNIIAKNAESYLDNLEEYLLEAINESNTSYVSEKGEVERWKGGVDKEKFLSDMKTNFKDFRKQVDDYKNNNTDD